jgi:hypothetical protein
VTRLWGLGVSIAVIVSAGDAQEEEKTAAAEPVSFTWQGRQHQVLEITKRWRVDVDWWRGRVWRSYFKCRTNTGLLVILYQDLVNQGWYLQRLYD